MTVAVTMAVAPEVAVGEGITVVISLIPGQHKSIHKKKDLSKAKYIYKQG